MISHGYAEMSVQFGVSYNYLNGGLGWGIFMIGVSCFFTNSLAVIVSQHALLAFLESTVC